MARLTRAVRNVRVSTHLVIYVLLVGSALTFFFIQYAGQKKGQTGDRMRNIKKMLEIHDGQTGGYPESLGALERVGIMIPPSERTDGWGREIRYQASGRLGRGDSGGSVFAECEIRSAGPNGDFGDDDDLVWTGRSGAGPAGGPAAGPADMPLRPRDR